MQSHLQDTIQTLLNTLVTEGKERGAQVAIYHEGKLVVDAWAGVSDVRTGQAVTGDSLFPVFSTTKGVMATIAHILAERGQLDYDTPIAHYWPEFATNGKESITLRHALAHTSGLYFMPEGIGHEQLANWDFMCRAVAQLKPNHPPGAKQIYHPVTYGWLVGEVAQRVTGRTIPQLFAEEICRPLGITSIYCGIPAELEPTVAFLELTPYTPPVIPPPPSDLSPCMYHLHEWMNMPYARCTPQPGCTGIMSARGVARHYAALLPGGVDGVELLSPERIRMATQEQVPSDGYPEGSTSRKGLGYQIGSDIIEVEKNPAAFGHFGHGGTMGFADPAHRLAIGITRNLYSDHSLTQAVMRDVYRALGSR